MTDDGTPHPVLSRGPEQAITDEDRNRYGLLLDRAAERGLIDAGDYQVRLRDLAEATSIDQMNRIVTELPAFTPAPAIRSRSNSRGRPPPRPGTAGGMRSSSPAPRRPAPWLLLAVVVAIMAVALVFLGVLVAHLGRTHNSGSPPPVAAVVAGSVSDLRL